MIVAGKVVLALEEQDASELVSLLLEALLITFEQRLVLCIGSENVLNMKPGFSSRLSDKVCDRMLQNMRFMFEARNSSMRAKKYLLKRVFRLISRLAK